MSEVSDWSEGVCGGAGYCGQPNLPALKGRRALLRAWRDCVLGASSGRLRAQASCWLLLVAKFSSFRRRCRQSRPLPASARAARCVEPRPWSRQAPGGLPSGVWYTPEAAPLPARAGKEARGPLDSGSLPSRRSKPPSQIECRDPSLLTSALPASPRPE